MSKKNKKFINVVYSTNPEFNYESEESDQTETLPSGEQKLYVYLDRKQRAGKEVTVVEGFVGSEEDLKNLGKELKVKCGVGGAVKEDLILIQGNFKDKIFDHLISKGYSSTKKRGG